MRVALVAAELEENLAVRYLWAALEEAGHEVVPVVFNAEVDTERAALEVAASRADLCGLSMVFTYRARQFAALAARARQLGYTGHVVAGGHFAAFHAAELLRDVAAVDSVAIGEGEAILCDLAASLGLGRGGAAGEPSSETVDLSAVRGLVWRAADGSARTNPAADKQPDLDRLPVPPRKRPLDHYLGVPITNILASRGCAYSCSFCSIVAWHRLCGGDRVRMRSVESVADEMAALYAAGARIFNFHDDNFFLPERGAMLERTAALGRALMERGVGRIAFAVKARPDAVDEVVFAALRELGLFRVFLGIEAGTRESLRALGRRQTVEQNVEALAVTKRLDIHTAFNLLLLNPDSTLDDVAGNVAFLRRHPENPMNFCRTEIYAGTPLEKTLRRRGRLEGDYWGYDYTMADARAQLAFEVIYEAFQTRNYGDDCLHHLAMGVDYEHQLCAHFFGTRSDLRQRSKRFVVEVNLDTCDALEVALAGCARGFSSPAERRAFGRELRARVEAGNALLGAVGHSLLDELRAFAARRAEPGEVVRGWSKTARAVGLAASVTIAAVGGLSCGESHPTEMVAPPPTAPPDASAPLPPPFPTHPSEMVAPPPSAPAADAGAPDASAPSDAGPPGDASAPTAVPTPKPPPPPPTTHRTEMIAPRMPKK